MANEVIYDADAALASELERAIIEESRPAMVAMPLCKIRDVIGQPTKALMFPKAPTAAAAAVAENVDLANTAAQPTSVTITASEVGIMFTSTDIGANSSIWGVQELTKLGARAMSEKWETDVTALFPSLATSVGTSGADFTVAQFLSAIYNLENSNAPGSYAFVGGTIQIADLRTAIVAAAGSVYGNPSADRVASLLSSPGNNGLKGDLFGVPVYASTTCTSANAAADRVGAMFSIGECFGWLWKTPLQVEIERNASLRAAEVVLTSTYGVGELVDLYGVKVVTGIS